MYICTPVYSGKNVRFFKIVVRFCSEKRQKLTKNGQKRCHFLRNAEKMGQNMRFFVFFVKIVVLFLQSKKLL